MPFQVIPRERSFFDLFERAADHVADGAAELKALAEDYSQAEARRARINEIEHAGDDLTHQIMETLSTTFVTPFDREDIYALATHLDDVLDAQDAAADLMVLHRIEEPLPEFRQQADVLHRAAQVVAEAVRGLRAMEGIPKYLVEINRLENEGDRVHRKWVARLYSGEFGAMDVLKWKDVAEAMEQAIDGCEDVANVIESITVKQA